MENLKNKDPYLEGKKIVLALSGGIDSIVLLHYLQQHFADNLRAVHCNHHLSKHADFWQDFCKNHTQSLNIDYKNVDIFIKSAANTEENARKERYRVLINELARNEVLCTAHHQSDQAETLLLQLFRGSGVAGLAAMPSQKILTKGVHYRPLLNVAKADIIAYAKQHNLRWIEDDSNTNTAFKRNFLRLDIIPRIGTMYKNLAKTLARSANHQAQMLQLSQELAQIDIKTHRLINDNNRLNAAKLAKISNHRAKNIIRYHLNTIGFLQPKSKVIKQMIALLSAKIDAKPLVCWHQYELRRYQNELYFIDTKAQPNNFCPFYAALKDLPNFSIAYRINGQRVKLAQKSHSQSLKKILQTAHIPPWERGKLRMYYLNKTLTAMERIGKMSA